MGRGHAYPPDLADYVVAQWPTESPLTITHAAMVEALSISFQASMTAEEGRPTRYRLLLTPPERLPEHGSPTTGVLRLRFDQTRPFTTDELRRLAPSVPFEAALIGAWMDDDGKLRIWGVAHSGPAWLAPTWGGRDVVPVWTTDPIVHVSGPGRLAVRCAGHLVGGLERGILVDAAMDVFESVWLAERFAQEREVVRTRHAAGQAGASAPTDVEHSLVRTVSQHMLRRVIQLVREARHGGMFLIVSSEAHCHADTLRLKYRFAPDEPTQRFNTLLMSLLDRLASRTTKNSVGWMDFATDLSPDMEELERAIFEVSRVIAGLAAIDGAVVLDKRFSIVGFGAEVSATLPAPNGVWEAIDVEGVHRQSDPVENVGTRHRAAYRFVRDHPQGLAIVISHDGAVRFVANQDGEVVFWSQSVSP